MRVDRLFLDANVLFTAAHRPQGKAGFLFEHAGKPGALPGDARWVLVSSAHAIEEARRNVALKRPQALPAFEALVRRLSVAPQPASARIGLALPAKDLPIWSAALAARVTHLLTGDIGDFGPHMNRPERTAGVLVQTVAQHLAGL